jgi:hypothetical protein
VLQYVLTHQEVMTHIHVGDDNSTPEQNMVRAEIESNSYGPFRALRISPPPMPCEAFVSGFGSGPSLYRLPVIRSAGVARRVSSTSRLKPGLVRHFFL